MARWTNFEQSLIEGPIMVGSIRTAFVNRETDQHFCENYEIEETEMSTDQNNQRAMIREAMQAIAERRQGRSRLIYDKDKRTIVAVTVGRDEPRALNIEPEDADMFDK